MIRRALAAADRWCFGATDPTAIAVFRILFGATAFLSLLALGLHQADWWGPFGLAPAFAAERWSGGAYRLSLLFGADDPALTSAVWGLTVLAALATCVGFGTRIATVLLALGLVTLHHRNPFLLHSGDTLMRVGAIWLSLAPAGAALSLDRRIAAARGRPLPVARVSVWPQRILQLQVALVYLATVYLKWQGETWRDGTAAWYPGQIREFDRFPVPPIFDQAPFVQLATWGTLAVEVALGTIAFTRWGRRWALAGGLLLHAAIEYRFNIPFFALTITSFYVLFYSGEEWSAWLGRRFGGRSGAAAAGPAEAA